MRKLLLILAAIVIWSAVAGSQIKVSDHSDYVYVENLVGKNGALILASDLNQNSLLIMQSMATTVTLAGETRFQIAVTGRKDDTGILVNLDGSMRHVRTMLKRGFGPNGEDITILYVQ